MNPLDATSLRDLALQATPQPCAACAPLVCPGWEAMPATVDSDMLLPCGTLRDASEDDPTLEEHHPGGTSLWSADAPIAARYFPYNLCSVWQCAQCRRVFLRYTEYGGYYEEERIREVRAALVVL